MPNVKGKGSAKKFQRQGSSSGPKGSAINLAPNTGADVTPSSNALDGLIDAEGSFEGSSTSSEDTVTQMILELPTKLTRPGFVPVSRENLAAVDPEIGPIAIEYILQYLRDHGEAMYAIAGNITMAEPDITPLSGTIEMSLNGITHCPTHVLAVTARTTDSTKPKVKLYVIHSLVLAANCAKLRPLPYVEAPTTGFVSLPIVPVSLPSPETFGIIRQFLYTHNVEDFCLSLLPTPEYELSEAELAKKLLEICPFRSLLSLLSTVYEVWANVLVLGIFDKVLWETLDRIWGAFIGALVMRPEKFGTRPDFREKLILLRVKPQDVENIYCFIPLTKPWPQLAPTR